MIHLNNMDNINVLCTNHIRWYSNVHNVELKKLVCFTNIKGIRCHQKLMK